MSDWPRFLVFFSFGKGVCFCNYFLSAYRFSFLIDPPDLGQCQVRFDNTKQKVIGECEIHKIFPKPVCDWFQQILVSSKCKVGIKALDTFKKMAFKCSLELFFFSANVCKRLKGRWYRRRMERKKGGRFFLFALTAVLHYEKKLLKKVLE